MLENRRLTVVRGRPLDKSLGQGAQFTKMMWAHLEMAKPAGLGELELPVERRVILPATHLSSAKPL